MKLENEVIALMPVVARSVKFMRLKKTAVFDYDDMVAAAYFGLVDAARRYDETRGASFSTFARHIAKWNIFTEYRDLLFVKKAHPTDDELVKFEGLSAETAEQYGGTMAEPEYLDDLFATLTKRERYIVRQSFWEGKTNTDIAKTLRVDRSGVSVALSNALKKMRTALEEGDVHARD